MILLVTKCPDLHSFYADSEYNGIYYLGYTDSMKVANIYAKQFDTRSYKVYAAEVTDNFLEGIKEKIGISEIELMENSKGKKWAFSSEELNYLDDTLAEYPDPDGQFDDLVYAIENLKRFKHPYIVKTVKRLKEIHKLMTGDYKNDEEYRLYNEIINSCTPADHYAFLASRIGLFKMDYFRKYEDER